MQHVPGYGVRAMRAARALKDAPATNCGCIESKKYRRIMAAALLAGLLSPVAHATDNYSISLTGKGDLKGWRVNFGYRF